MPELTDPDSDGLLEFTETAEDIDGDNLNITGELDQIDGVTQSGSARNPSWFSYTTSSSISGGTRTVDVDISIDASELGPAGTVYTFEFTADDGISTATRTFTLKITQSVDGSRLFIHDNQFNDVLQYDLGSNWDITTLSFVKKTPSPGATSPSGLEFKIDGTPMFGNYSDGRIEKYPLPTAWDIGSINSRAQKHDVSNANEVQGLRIRNNGKVIYGAGWADVSLLKFEMSTPYDLTTVTEKRASVSGNMSFVGGIEVKPDESKVYLGDITTNKIHQYTMNTPGDISTLSHDKEINLDGGPKALIIRPNGETLYYTEGQKVTQVPLNTAWDIGSTGTEEAKDISANIDTAKDLKFGVT